MPSTKPPTPGSQPGRPEASASSMAGMSRLHTEAAIITPAAKPRKIRWMDALSCFRNRKTMAAPRVVIKKVKPVPVAQHKEGVLAANEAVMNRLKGAGIRVKMDDSDQSAGWKFAEYEMKGVPLRLEMGPKDMEKNQCVLVRRDNGEKSFVSLDNIEETVKTMLDAVQQGLFEKAKRNLDENTYACASLEEVKEKMASQGGFAKTMWCGDLECELKMKEEAGVSSRCIPLEQGHLGDVCPICGKPAKHMVYWGVAY